MEENKNSNREYLTIKDVQQLFHIGHNTAYSLFHTKGFPYVRVGRKYLVEKEKLYKFLEGYSGSQIHLS